MRNFLVPVLLLLSALRAASSPAVFEVEWASELALQNPARAIERMRSPFDSPVTLRHASQSAQSANCASLLQYRKSGFTAVSDRDAEVIQSIAVDCLAIEALEHAKPVHISFLRTFRMDLRALDILPPDLAPVISDDDRRNIRSAASKGLSWKQFDPSATASIERDALTVLADDTRTVVKIYGRGDFNSDGIDDLLVRVDATALHGTYRCSRLLLLTRMRANVPIRLLRELT